MTDWQTLINGSLKSYRGVAYRLHNPVWAWSPLSGEGAARCGGRFNPKSVAALYLGTSINGCIAEVSAGFSSKLLEPLVLCSYRVDIEGLLDLRGDKRFAAPWRTMLLQGKTPPGWQLCEAALATKQINGLIVDSYQTERESNLVLFRYNSQQLKLHDPDERLRAVYGNKLLLGEDSSL